MRFWILLVAAFSYCVTISAQSFNDSIATRYITDIKQGFNEKLWSAVSTGKLIAYRNDSLRSVVPKDSLNSWFKVFERREIDDSNEGVFNRYGTVVFEPQNFNPQNDFTGLSFIYSPKWDVESAIYSNQLIAIGPLWRVTTESGIELGNHVLFLIKIEDLTTVFSPDEIKIIKALGMQRSTLGDFKFRYLNEFSSSEDIANSMLWNSIADQKSILALEGAFDTILGNYETRLISTAAGLANETGTVFYKNEKLTLPYKNIEVELNQDIEVPVPNPDNPDDPYDFIGVKVNVSFSFYNGYSYEIFRSKNGYVIKINYLYDDDDVGIYFSYASIKNLLKPHDQIILEALMTEITQ